MAGFFTNVVICANCFILLFCLLCAPTGSGAQFPESHQLGHRLRRMAVRRSIQENGPEEDFVTDEKTRRIPLIWAPSESFEDEVCLRDALLRCDMKGLVEATLGDFCSVFDAYQTCIRVATPTCRSPDLALLKSSLLFLAVGYQANGHCPDLPLVFRNSTNVNDLEDVPACAVDGTWTCAEQLLGNLVRYETTCEALFEFRNCLETRTRSCPYVQSRYLRDGVAGVCWSYKKANLCPFDNRFVAEGQIN